MFSGHLGGPGFDLVTADLNRRATRAADQVMVMMRCRATAVHRLAGIGAHHIDEIRRLQRLQSAIDGGQSDVRAVAAQLVVQFLRRTETVELLQQGDDRPALPGGPDAAADGTQAGTGGGAVRGHFH